MIVSLIALCSFLLMPPVWAEEAWQKEWNQVVAAGKEEGKVVVQGSPDPVMRKKIIPMFTNRFGIPVEFLAGSASVIAARVGTERRAGVYSMDVYTSGPDTTANVLYGQKMIDPLKPLLMLPEVVDGAKWKKGSPWFIDPEGEYVLRPFSSVADIMYINTEYVKPEEMRSGKDLLNPKWKGKIASEDPLSSGRGANQAARFLLTFGPEYLAKLYKGQQVVHSRDRRQLADWLARGKHPICLTCSEDDVRPLEKAGFKFLRIYYLSDMTPPINGSPFLVTVANKAPHPNAARVFVNWLVSKEGLETYSRGYGTATLRTDVDESFLEPENIPRSGVEYFDDTGWQWINGGRKEARDRVKKILEQ